MGDVIELHLPMTHEIPLVPIEFDGDPIVVRQDQLVHCFEVIKSLLHSDLVSRRVAVDLKVSSAPRGRTGCSLGALA